MSEKSTSKINVGSLYEMNQQLFKQMPTPKKDVIDIELANVGAWFSSNHHTKYYMLLCKERSDYTLIHLQNFNFDKATTELKEILEERGEIMGLDFVHGENAYQCWVRERKENPEVYMFMLFEADWMVVDV